MSVAKENRDIFQISVIIIITNVLSVPVFVGVRVCVRHVVKQFI